MWLVEVLYDLKLFEIDKFLVYRDVFFFYKVIGIVDE